MSTINDSDLLLVERNGNLHQITYDQMSTLNDDDILLVERGGVQYKVEAQYVSTGPNGVILPSVEVLTPVNGAGLNEGDPYTPISSAYVSTDSTPIYHRYFPVAITTVSGGTWVDENNIFDNDINTYAELTGTPDAVSQVVYTAPTTWVDGETSVYASNVSGGDGGSIEVLDENDSVLRTYTLKGSLVETAIGIVRVGNKIRFTTSAQNIGLYLAHIARAHTDYVISGRVAFEFTDSTDLDKMVAPIIMTDENGDVKVPTTSTVDSTTTITGVSKSLVTYWNGGTNSLTFTGNDAPGAGYAPLGARMLWAKANTSVSGIISDSEDLLGFFLRPDTISAKDGSFGPELRPTESFYPTGGSFFNVQYVKNFIAEIGVAPKVLDIVTYTGDGRSLREIPHNLGIKPGMIIIKRLENSGDWPVWHKDVPMGELLYLNMGGSSVSGTHIFPSEPTKDAFYVASDIDCNATAGRYVAYVFGSEAAGRIKCGVYVGQGGDQFLNLDFQPGFFITKKRDYGSNWCASTTDISTFSLFWEVNSSLGLQGNGSAYPDLNSYTNRVFLRGGDDRYNGNANSYVYLAIAADLTGPNSTQLNLLSGQDLEYFTDGTEITSNLAANGSNISFGSRVYTGNGGTAYIYPQVGGEYFMDTRLSSGNKWLVWIKSTSSSYDHYLVDSERHPDNSLSSNLTSAEQYDNVGYQESYDNIGYTLGSKATINSSGQSFISWNFQAAPQFFDVVKYAGNSSNPHVIEHDLGVTPGCIITKRLNASTNWVVYHSSLPVNKYLVLNASGTAAHDSQAFLSVNASSFTLGSSSATNNNNDDYISYIFADGTPYVKCGNYTGNGSSQVVNTGFQPRWVLIKRTNDNGDWVMLDKELAPTNDALWANGAYAKATLPYAFDFEGFALMTSTADVNASGSTYVYVAIADEVEGHPPFPPSSSTVQGTPDVNTATMVVNAESFDVGDSASAPALEASITAVAGSEGNTLFVEGSTGEWLPGLYAKGTEITLDAPGPDEITFTSQNQGTSAFSGVDATLASRTWTLESGTTATGPWTVVDSYVDYDVLASQDGASPWSTNKPNLTPNTYYRIKVQYNSTNAESVESVYNTFKTGDA